MSDYAAHRALLDPVRSAMRDWDGKAVRAALHAVMAPGVQVHMCHPFGDLTGADAFFDGVMAPLQTAMPDVERRDWIVMAGPDDHGYDWIGCAGHYVGTFLRPFLDIPMTGHLAHMRFHEFYRVAGGRVVEVQAIWDIPELMMQAGAWPMAPSLGRECWIPGPASQDGLRQGAYDQAASESAKAHVLAMLAAMGRHPQEPPEAMEMPKFWHPQMNWYGPAGIGTGRGVAGFRNWHQIPFLAAMPDRGKYRDTMGYHFFGDGPYVAVTGWPNMKQTLSLGGWLGLAPTGTTLTMCSLDFWRLENGRIRENWVLLDMLDIYRQLGVDVLARMGEFNKARAAGPLPIAKDYS